MYADPPGIRVASSLSEPIALTAGSPGLPLAIEPAIIMKLSGP